MDNNIFEIIKLVLQIGLIVLTAFVVPAVRKWLMASTTKEQREEAKFWASIAIVAAESIYKERGQGRFKKEWVLDWLNNNGIKITDEQADLLIDMIVDEFNTNGWDISIIKPVE